MTGKRRKSHGTRYGEQARHFRTTIDFFSKKFLDGELVCEGALLWCRIYMPGEMRPHINDQLSQTLQKWVIKLLVDNLTRREKFLVQYLFASKKPIDIYLTSMLTCVLSWAGAA
jgi:hypothetical protein